MSRSSSNKAATIEMNNILVGRLVLPEIKILNGPTMGGLILATFGGQKKPFMVDTRGISLPKPFDKMNFIETVHTMPQNKNAGTQEPVMSNDWSIGFNVKREFPSEGIQCTAYLSASGTYTIEGEWEVNRSGGFHITSFFLPRFSCLAPVFSDIRWKEEGVETLNKVLNARGGTIIYSSSSETGPAINAWNFTLRKPWSRSMDVRNESLRVEFAQNPNTSDICLLLKGEGFVEDGFGLIGWKFKDAVASDEIKF